MFKHANIMEFLRFLLLKAEFFLFVALLFCLMLAGSVDLFFLFPCAILKYKISKYFENI